MVRLHVLRTSLVAPGAEGLVRVHLPEPLPLRPGDRYVLRDAGADVTIGGGEVLDIDPIRSPREARPDRRWERVVDEHGWIPTDRLLQLTGQDVPPTVGPWVVSPSALEHAREELLAAADAAGSDGLLLRDLSLRARLLLTSGLIKDLEVDGESAHRVDTGPLVEHPWMAALRTTPFRPPAPNGVPPHLVRSLLRRGQVIDLGGILFPVEAIITGTAVVRGAAAGREVGLTVSEVRELLSTSRRFALALLAHFDAVGITTLREDGLRTVHPLTVPPSDHPESARPK
jgi:selenocysteine-specific elongation factor